MTNTCRSNEHEQRRPASSSNTGSSADDNANLEGTENDADMQAEDGSTPNAAADQQANPPHPPPPRQSIRFAPSSSTRHVPSLHDLDDDVLRALYYDEDENSDMLLDVVRNITAMRRHQQEQPEQPQAPQQQGLNRSEGANANPPVEGEDGGMQGEEEEEYCFRGLEHMRDGTVMQMRQQAKNQVIDDVLDEQERQRADEDDGIAPPSPERLAAVSRAGSVSARNRGIVMGILDEAAVRRDRDADGEEEEEGLTQQDRPRQEGAGGADNSDNGDNIRRDESDGGDGGGDTLRDILGAAGRMGLE